MSRWFPCVLFVLVPLGAAVGAGVHQPPEAIGRLDLFARLQAAQHHKAGKAPQRVDFHLSDKEINNYMAYSLRTTPRPGVESVAVKAFPGNYVSTFTVVDFDAIERRKPGTVPTLLRPVLNGKKEVWVDYRFRASDGQVTFTVEKAYFQSVRLPAVLVEKMIQIVAARQPEKYDTAKPLPLPFGLRRVWTGDHSVAGEN